MKDETLRAELELIQRFDRPVGTEWDTTVPIYVERELKDELEAQYRELVYERLQCNEPVPLRNMDFYPAVIQAALNGTSIEYELEVSDL